MIEYVTPAPAVDYLAPGPGIDYVTALLVIEYSAPAPSVTSATPSGRFSPAHTMAAVTTGVVSPRCSTTAVQGSPTDKFARLCTTKSFRNCEETIQNSVEIPTEAASIVDQGVDVPPVAAPAPADDAPVPATAFQTADFGYDAFHRRH